jgi:lipopolysaccharide export system permease protein
MEMLLKNGRGTTPSRPLVSPPCPHRLARPGSCGINLTSRVPSGPHHTAEWWYDRPVPWTLYSYILRELLKVLLATAAVLTAVMSVAFAIMSVTEAQLGPWAMAKIIVLVLPGMLTVALPFAAAMAGTLVFFRMSQDNEVTACAVSGISYRSVLTPVLVLGLVLTGGMFWFSNWVVPRFWRMAEREGTADAVRLAMRKVQQRQVIEWSGWVIRADAAAMISSPPPVEDDPQARRPAERLVLEGVAMGRVDADEVLHATYTARRAVIDLYRDEDQDQASATMLLEHVSRNDPASGTMPYIGSLPIGAIEVPTFFHDRPQFMSLDRLRRLAAEPHRSTKVRQARRELVEQIARVELLNRLAWDLSGPRRSVEMLNLQGWRVRVTAGQATLDGTELKLRASHEGRILVTEYLGDAPRERLEAESGVLALAETFEEGEPRVNLRLEQVALEAGAEARLARVEKPLLSLRQPVLEPMRKLKLDQVLDQAAAYDHKRIAVLTSRIRELIANLHRDISSRLHERAATAANGALVLMLGAVMSIRLRHRTPLTIFFWCFMPTVAAFLMISSGQQMTSWSELPISLGLAMTWAGNLGLLLLIGGVYARLRRN